MQILRIRHVINKTSDDWANADKTAVAAAAGVAAVEAAASWMLVLEPFAGLALANSFQLNDFISTTRATFATDALDIEHPQRCHRCCLPP